jgi:hypothetical protein
MGMNMWLAEGDDEPVTDEKVVGASKTLLTPQKDGKVRFPNWIA